jgi:serine protease DegS
MSNPARTLPLVLIAGVLSDGPADKAGLLPGDIVTAINDTRVTDATAAMKKISDQQPGSVIRLGGSREGKAFSLSATVSERPGNTRNGAAHK